MNPGTLIVCEGIDGTGKTTLAKALALRLRGVYIHASGRNDMLQCMWQYHEEILKTAAVNLKQGLTVVLDRHWPSEYCYARVLRPSRDYFYDESRMAEKMDALVPHFIYCDNFDAIKIHAEEHKNQEHKYTDLELSRILDEYQILFKDLKKQYPVSFYQLQTDGRDLETYFETLKKKWAL